MSSEYREYLYLSSLKFIRATQLGVNSGVKRTFETDGESQNLQKPKGKNMAPEEGLEQRTAIQIHRESQNCLILQGEFVLTHNYFF